MNREQEISTDNSLTARDVAALREAEVRGRERLSLDEARDGLQPILAQIAKLAGAPAPQNLVWRCAGGCGAEVQRRGHYCAPCAERDVGVLRAYKLRDAYESVARAGAAVRYAESLDWCRAGTTQYAESTARALAAARQLDDGGAAARIVAEAAWKRSVGNLVIVGPKRIGKTKTAIAIAHRVLDAARDGQLDAAGFKFATRLRFVSCLKLGRARAETKLGGAPELVTLAERASLLILNEVGYEEDVSAMRDLIDDRYEDRGRPTIITSGRTIEELADRYGANTIDRLVERRGMIIDLHPRSAGKAA